MACYERLRAQTISNEYNPRLRISFHPQSIFVFPMKPSLKTPNPTNTPFTTNLFPSGKFPYSGVNALRWYTKLGRYNPNPFPN